MRVFRRVDALPAAARGASVAMGNFDGLHRGHRAVVDVARSAALQRGAPLALLTFEPHPRELLTPGAAPRRLTPFRRKVELAADLGCAFVVALPFESALMRLAPDEFASRVLVGRLAVGAVAVGRDFRFGHKRSGDFATLAALGREHGFAVAGVPPVEIDGTVCSSTAIRTLLADGEIAAANGLLGYPYEIDGIVRPGEQRGRALGFPTANLHPTARRQMLPAIGVYAVRAGLAGEQATVWHPAVANLGRRPTFDGRTLLLEVHLLDGRHELYGRRLKVAFLERLRGEERFAGIDELKAQIARDCAAARRVHGVPVS
jgi:riboflavin kinase/FMN adenylyltransferase